MPEPVEGTPLLAPAGARAPPPRDTRIYVERSEAEPAALRSQGCAAGSGAPGGGAAGNGRAGALGGVVVGNGSAGGAAVANGSAASPGEDDASKHWENRGIFATVAPVDSEKIRNALRERVDTRLHKAVLAQDLAALETVLAAKASPAALDWEGRTPLHLCVVLRLMEPLKVLLREPGIADVRDASGLTLLRAALLHGWRSGACALLDAGATVGSECENVVKSIYSSMNRYPDVEQSKFCSSFIQLPIEIAMESGDMKMFEMIMNAAKREGTLDMPNGSCKSALISAIENSNLPAIQALLSIGASLDRGPKKEIKTTALHAAVHDRDILVYLLELPNVTCSMATAKDYCDRIPLHAAAAANNPESVRLLIDKYKNTRAKDMFQATPLHYAAIYASYEAAVVLLEKDLEAMKEMDEQGDTPLHSAAKYNSRKVAELLLQKGGLISNKNTNGVTVLELISNNYYDASIFFGHLFDKHISSKNVKADIKISVDYRVLTNEKGMSQINVLEEFVRCGQSKMLIHPLIESLLYLKWIHFLPLFYALISVYSIFLVSVNVFVINVFYHGDINSRTTNSTFKMPRVDEFHAGAQVYWVLIVLISGSIFLLLIQEVFFIYVKSWRYFRSVESWVKLAGLVLCAATPPLAALVPEPWPRHAACAALMLVWLEAMFLVSHLLGWGYYAIMFGKVALDMLKILVTVIFLVIGFAICFMIQYRWAPPFDDLFAALVKTLVMLSSEFDYEGLFGEDHDKQLENTKTIVRVLFVMFLIFMAIVLMNFMTGVAVDDISDLNKIGNIKRLMAQIALLSCFDYLVYEGLFAKWLNKILGDKRFTASMHTYRRTPIWWEMVSPSLKRSPIEHQIQISSSKLYNGIMETADRNEQRAETEQHDAAKKSHESKLDALYNAIVDNPVIKNKKGKRHKQWKSDSVTLKQQIKKLFKERSKVTHEIKKMKCQLSLQSTAILTTLKDIAANKDAGISNN